jgi:radical SAM superfamily enzyme YgiQ (UPF0313 family)
MRLAESGADTVWVGAESGSQKILDAMDKGTTVGQIHKASALLREKKLRSPTSCNLVTRAKQKKTLRKPFKWF